MITYQTYSPTEGLFARRFDPAGAPVSSPILLPTLAQAADGIVGSFGMSRDGRFVVLWGVEDYPSAGEQIVVGQRFAVDGQPLGTLPFPGAE